DPDVLGQCHGFVRGGGALISRLPPSGQTPRANLSRMAVWPYTVDDVGDRCWQLFETALARAQVAHPEPIAPVTTLIEGTAEQAAVVERLVSMWSGDTPSRVTLIADRGRGKSAAMGLALRPMGKWRIAVTGGDPNATREVLRFARDGDLEFVPLAQLLNTNDPYDIIVVDEAAQVPVPMLQRLVHAQRDAHLAFATTTHGYEGTGRGFGLRFVSWLEDKAGPVTSLTLDTPIRWAFGDPVEACVFDALLLDAEPAEIAVADVGALAEAAVPVAFDRDRLLADRDLLRQFFGLLVQAHYRTTPGDLQRMLDA